MKKKYLFLFILLFYMPVYPQEKSDFISYLRNNSSLWKDYENANDMKYYKDIDIKVKDTDIIAGLIEKYITEKLPNIDVNKFIDLFYTCISYEIRYNNVGES